MAVVLYSHWVEDSVAVAEAVGHTVLAVGIQSAALEVVADMVRRNQ